jgi:hypothetical protein
MSAKLLVFAVFDSKAEVYGTPIFFGSRGLAIRSFDQECNREESQIFKYPGDFTLFQIGEYDQDTGLLTPLSSHTSLGTGVEFKRDERIN